MKKYKITFRWFGTEGKSEICEQFIESESVQGAIDKFNETHYDCPIRSVEEMQPHLLVDLIGSKNALQCKTKDEAIRISHLIRNHAPEVDYSKYGNELCYGMKVLPMVAVGDIDEFKELGFEIIDSNFVK